MTKHCVWRFFGIKFFKLHFFNHNYWIPIYQKGLKLLDRQASISDLFKLVDLAFSQDFVKSIANFKKNTLQFFIKL